MGFENFSTMLVGVKRGPNGEADFSQAAVWRPEIKNKSESIEKPALSEAEAQSLYMQLVTCSEFEKKIRIGQAAKQRGVRPEQILREVKEQAKRCIRSKEKGDLRHFHRTSLEKFRMIVEKGKMLSRSRLRQAVPEIQLTGFSARDDVMMTRDKFDAAGKMREPGFSDREVVGASGKGVILVFKESIMDRRDYDAVGLYPTISELPLAEYCEVVLADSSADCEAARRILADNKLNIPVELKSEWQRK